MYKCINVCKIYIVDCLRYNWLLQFLGYVSVRATFIGCNGSPRTVLIGKYSIGVPDSVGRGGGAQVPSIEI